MAATVRKADHEPNVPVSVKAVARAKGKDKDKVGDVAHATAPVRALEQATAR